MLFCYLTKITFTMNRGMSNSYGTFLAAIFCPIGTQDKSGYKSVQLGTGLLGTQADNQTLKHHKSSLQCTTDQ